MDTARYPNLRPLVDRRLDDMKARGLTVGRTWGFSLGTGESMVQRQQALQLKPGVYDEGVFTGLDYALVAARKRGIKLILCLEDYWLSVDRYIAWSPTAGTKTDFYTDWNVRQMYKSHLRCAPLLLHACVAVCGPSLSAPCLAPTAASSPAA
jgi:mannan endo-1,4-beta-mannosidase